MKSTHQQCSAPDFLKQCKSYLKDPEAPSAVTLLSFLSQAIFLRKLHKYLGSVRFWDVLSKAEPRTLKPGQPFQEGLYEAHLVIAGRVQLHPSQAQEPKLPLFVLSSLECHARAVTFCETLAFTKQYLADVMARFAEEKKLRVYKFFSECLGMAHSFARFKKCFIGKAKLFTRDVVFKEGQPITSYYFIKRGTISLIKNN
jgi:hypothetical protein